MNESTQSRTAPEKSKYGVVLIRIAGDYSHRAYEHVEATDTRQAKKLALQCYNSAMYEAREVDYLGPVDSS